MSIFDQMKRPAWTSEPVTPTPVTLARHGSKYKATFHFHTKVIRKIMTVEQLEALDSSKYNVVGV